MPNYREILSDYIKQGDPGNPISTITGKPLASVEERLALARDIFNALSYLKKNIFPGAGENLHPGMEQSFDWNPRRFIDKSDPNYQPSIFAEPKPNILLGEIDPPGLKPFKLLRKKPLRSVADLNVPRKIQSNVWTKIQSKTNPNRKITIPNPELGTQSQKFLRRIKNNTGNEAKTGALRNNQKTGLSIDFSTDCAKRHGSHGACPYCYVEHGRVAKDLGLGFMSGARVGEYPYKRNIMYMPKQLVEKFNTDGGLRMFSLGDYRPGIDNASVQTVLSDANKRGLFIKAITKQKEFIDDWARHPNLRANISVDALPRHMSNAPTVEEALSWTGGRDNIKVRAVALNDAQAEWFGNDPRIDIVTLYHGITDTDKLMKLISKQNPKLIETLGEDAVRKEISTWGFKQKGYKKKLEEKFPDKICCQSGKCGGDRTKCGFGLIGLGAILAGVMIPENEMAEP